MAIFSSYKFDCGIVWNFISKAGNQAEKRKVLVVRKAIGRPVFAVT